MPDGSRPRSNPRRWSIALFCALVAAPLLWTGVAATIDPMPAGQVLEIEMRSTGGTTAQVFWSRPDGFFHEDSSTAPLHQHPGTFETLRFPVPQRRMAYVRFDALDGEGTADIRAVRLLDRQGRVVRTIDPILIAPLYQIARVSVADGVVTYTTTPKANDPMLLARGTILTAPPRWWSPFVITPFSLGWIALAVAVSIGVVLATLGGDIVRDRFTSIEALWLGALFLGILAAKLFLLRHFPQPVPFWDQWDGEAMPLYVPYADRALGWMSMFAFHNEHRIYFSRVQALALLALNGQWDPQVQILVNSVLHALTATALAGVTWVAAGRRWMPAIAFVVALAVAPPFAMENTLAGFQSAFYYLVLFSIGALWLLGTREPGTAGWWLGGFCALCAIFTVGGGLLIVPAAIVIVLLRGLSRQGGWRRLPFDGLLLGTVATVGYAVVSPPLEMHAYLRPQTTLDLLRAFLHNLAFPWIIRGSVAPILWLPIAITTALVLWRRLRASHVERWTLGLGAWVVVQAAAVAYSRGAGGAAPASRYLDMFSLSLVVNVVALLALVDRWPGWRALVSITAGVSLVILGVGTWHLSREILALHGPMRRGWSQAHVRNVRAFLTAPDLDAFLKMKGPDQLPYSVPMLLAGMLMHPYIRGILPPDMRVPLMLVPATASAGGFGEGPSSIDMLPVWDSYGTSPAQTGLRFESAPIACATLPYLQFELAAPARWTGLDLHLHEVASGRDIPIVPGALHGTGFAPVQVPCPAGPFTVVASDDSPDAWFAFRSPSEAGRLSVMAEQAVALAPVIGLGSLALALLAIAYTLVEPRPLTSATAATEHAV